MPKMTDGPIISPTGALPPPFDGARAKRTLDELAERGLSPPPEVGRVLESLFGNSPYLARLALRDSEVVSDLAAHGPAATFAAILDSARAVAQETETAQAMAILRRAKRHAALIIAFADVSGAWDLDAVTAALSEFADACLQAALRLLLRQTAAGTPLADRPLEQLEAESGLVVLAMGKHGSRELNYSSDIDLVVFYDDRRFPFTRRGDARAAAVDLVKGLVRLIHETTADGYVFRLDLRLRPDAGATQVAISTGAAEVYYETLGQNWERAALIKARPCIGDRAAAAQFLRTIEPFVWRRNLDYAAIEDIHSIKRQIHAHGGHGAIAVAGHNIKLGRGGIREIEFFVQTQQLILGGRDRALRVAGTLSGLAALRDRGRLSAEAASQLSEAYRFLRVLEHRLQMIEDQQTHTVPDSDEGLAHIACFMGCASVETFSNALRQRLELVQMHYARLFESAPPLSAAKGSLVFTGVEDDPETLATLSELGFADAHHVAHAIRGWHHGRIRATRSARARELLTKLIPPLLDALAASADPDAGFAQFDRFISRLTAGVSLFSMLLANPQLLKRIAEICGCAPRFADYLASSPRVLDALLDPEFLNGTLRPEEIKANLAQQLAAAGDYEEKLDAARRVAKEEIFRTGIQVIDGSLPAAGAATAFTNVAETIVRGLLPVVENELARTAGGVRGGAFVVVTLGRLGAREMTATSDLDLIFVYDFPHSVEQSDGPKRLPPPSYYSKLAQRFIASLTTPTSEGRLYEVDMRLRPTGNKGPVAVSLESFARYHADEAWTWERMALTRARVICGTSSLSEQVQDAIREALTTRRDPQALRRDVREMREKLASQHPARRRWDLKFAAGGLVDVEFANQYLQLREAPANPSVLETNTIASLKRLAGAGALNAGDAQSLIDAGNLQLTLLQVLRIALEGSDARIGTKGLDSLLVRAVGERDFEGLEARLSEVQQAARTTFERLLYG